MAGLFMGLYRALMIIGSLVCHQRPERSPHIWNIQMPLCWRCSGILIGTLLFLTWLIVRRSLPSVTLSLTLAALLPLDVLSAVLRLWSGHNAMRLITGVLWGVFGMSLALHLLRKLRFNLRGETGLHRLQWASTTKD